MYSCTFTKTLNLESSEKIIIILGNSSCGKSSTARSLQSLLANKNRPYVLLSVDGFNDILPTQWTSRGDKKEGLMFHKTNDKNGPKITPIIGRHTAYVRAKVFPTANIIVNDEIGVIIEGVVSNLELKNGIQEINRGKVTTVLIDCSLKVAQEREKKRGGEFIGLARGVLEEFPLPGSDDVDITINTDKISMKDAAKKIYTQIFTPTP